RRGGGERAVVHRPGLRRAARRTASRHAARLADPGPAHRGNDGAAGRQAGGRLKRQPRMVQTAPRGPCTRPDAGTMLGTMEFEHILVERSGDFATVTMNRPQRRNALSLGHMRELIAAFGDLAGSDALGIVLAGNGPVFSAGHDFADVAGADLPTVRSLLM